MGRRPAPPAPEIVAAVERPPVPPIIGTLNEKHLHATLRGRYLQPGDQTEVPIDGYIVDILRNDHAGEHIIEIQTKNFSAIARKMRALVQHHRVRLVHPMPRELWIVKLPREASDGSAVETLRRRKSPRRRDTIDIFDELVAFPELIAHENFQLDVVLTTEERIERYDSPKRWRRRGWVTVERRLLAIDSTITLHTPGDFMALIPPGLPDPFLTSDIAAAINRPRALAQKAAYCLRHANCITRTGQKGNAALYTHVNPVAQIPRNKRRRSRPVPAER